MTGGPRGLAETAAPGLAFLLLAPRTGTAVAAVAAAGLVLVLAGLRWRAGASSSRALAGAGGLVVAVASVAVLGGARDYFLPGIAVDLAWASGLLVSAGTRRPAAAVVARRLLGEDAVPDHRRAALAGLTLLWAAACGLRGGTQLWLYLIDEAALLAVAKTALGWPLTGAVLAVSLRVLARPARTGLGASGG